MVKCLSCKDTFDDCELDTKRVSLGDDFMGTGPSYITEYYCPNCGHDEFEDGYLCSLCDEFIENREFHFCEGSGLCQSTEDF